MKLVIERDRWLRGEGVSTNALTGNGARLLRSTDQKMCCLGFFGLACGLRPADIVDVTTPLAQTGTFRVCRTCWPAWALDVTPAGMRDNSIDINTLMRINDASDLSEPTREATIARIFLRHGVEVEFVDTGVDLDAEETPEEAPEEVLELVGA